MKLKKIIWTRFYKISLFNFFFPISFDGRTHATTKLVYLIFFPYKFWRKNSCNRFKNFRFVFGFRYLNVLSVVYICVVDGDYKLKMYVKEKLIIKYTIH